MNKFTMNRDMINTLTADLEIPDAVDQRIDAVLADISGQPADAKQSKQKKQNVFRNNARKAVAIVATCVLAVPGVALAAYASGENSPFYQAVFGDSVRPSISEKTEYDAEGRMSLNLPNSERVNVDEETADELVGEYVTSDTGIYELNRYLDGPVVLTVENVLYDSTTGIFQSYMSFEGSGIKDDFEIFTDGECMFNGNGVVVAGNIVPGKMYYDGVNSTDNKVYVTAVGVGLDQNAPKTMEFYEYVDASQVKPEDMPYELEETADSELPQEVGFQLATVDFSSISSSLPSIKAGDSIVLNSVGIQLDLPGLGFTDAVDDYDLKYIAIEYVDGSNYVLRNRDAHTENTDYAITASSVDNPDVAAGTHTTYCFNRIVDTNQVAKVIINDTEYAIE